MPPEHSEGGINFCEGRRSRSGRRRVVVVRRWRGRDWRGRSATAQEAGELVGQSNTIIIGMGKAGWKARDDIGGKLGSNGRRVKLRGRRARW